MRQLDLYEDYLPQKQINDTLKMLPKPPLYPQFQVQQVKIDWVSSGVATYPPQNYGQGQYVNSGGDYTWRYTPYTVTTTSTIRMS